MRREGRARKGTRIKKRGARGDKSSEYEREWSEELVQRILICFNAVDACAAVM